jgi:hypothetical protein
MELSLKNILIGAGLVASSGLVGLSVWVYDYHQNFVTQEQVSIDRLNDRLSNSRVLVTMYELKGITKLTEMQKAQYQRENDTLKALRTKKAELIGEP